jgi:4-methylaminobutanoate oxidase (formaldehyde-forming)
MTESTKKSPNQFPSRAQVVIIGGGVIGCSVAYHLTKLGWNDVILLERTQLTAGTTWHAAGLVEAGGFFDETTLGMAKYTRELYQTLEAETGQSTGYKSVGYLELATSPSRLEGYRRISAFDRGFGVNFEEISPSDCKELWPAADTTDVLAGFFCPEDGRVNPIDATIALAKGARMGSAQIFEETEVTGITVKNGRVFGVSTNKGDLEAEFVVNCAGMWARDIGKMAGVDVPLQAAEHYYLITEPIDSIHTELPVLVDADSYAYYREETGGVLLGLFEPISAPWGLEGIPKDFSFGEIQPDWDRMMPYVEVAMKRIPVMQDAGVHKMFCGPESFTPDLGPLMGEAPEVQNFFVAAGFNSLGILLGGGAGRVIANWIVEGLPDVDVSEIDIARMSSYQNDRKFLQVRTTEILGATFWEPFPNRHFQSGRGVRKSPYHDRLAAAGAFFGAYAGLEYPDWYAPEGVEPKVEYSYGRQNWFEFAAAEHHATRNSVTLMDYSVMGKLLVQGRDAEKELNRICANNIAVPVGKIVYTQWLNHRGMIEADLTVTRLAEDEYIILTGEGTITKVMMWLNRNIPPEAHIRVTNISSTYSVLNIQGPKSREFLNCVTNADMSNEAFPFLTMQEIDIGYSLVKAFRVTYVGELGWELYIPTEFSVHVFNELVEFGEDFGLRYAGLQALDSLRIEKAYRDYGNDVDNMDNPLEAGLGYFVDFDKPDGFIGKETLLEIKEKGIPKYRLVQFLLDDPQPLMHYGETIYEGGMRVGYIRAGNYGHTLGGSVGLGFVENQDGVSSEYVKQGKFEIDIAGQRYPATASLRPMYDPKLGRVRS